MGGWGGGWLCGYRLEWEAGGGCVVIGWSGWMGGGGGCVVIGWSGWMGGGCVVIGLNGMCGSPMDEYFWLE